MLRTIPSRPRQPRLMPATAKTRSPFRRCASPIARTSHSTLDGISASRRGFLKGSASVTLVSGLGGSLLSGCGGGLDADLPETPRLASVTNFRDLAGVGGGY